MTLTVPQSGSVAGRSADLRAVPNQTGDILAGFAGQLTQIGVALEDDRRSRELNRLTIDLTRDFNNLSLELREIGDPDELDRQWQARSAELRAAYENATGENGRPRVDPANRDRFGLAFDDMSYRHAFNIGARSLELRQSQRQADFLTYSREAATAAAATPDPELRATLIDQGIAQIDQMVAAGIWTPEEGARQRQAFEGEVANAAIITQIAEDPAGVIAAIGNGQYNTLGAEALARYAVQAQNELDRQATAAQTEAERIERERLAAIDDRLGNIANIFELGRMPTSADQAFLASEEARSRPGYARAMAANDLILEYPTLLTMTPAELEAELAIEQQTPIDAPFRNQRLELLEQVLGQAREAETARMADLNDRLGEVGTIAASGRMPSDELRAALADPAAPDQPNYGRAAAHLALLQEHGNLRQMPLAALEAVAAAEQRRPARSPADTLRGEAINEILAEARTAVATDPVAHWAAAGLQVTPLPEGALADPGLLQSWLGVRQGEAAALVASGHLRDGRIMAEAERAALTAAARDINQPPEQRAALAAVLVGGLPRTGPDGASTLIDDPVFLHMGEMVATGTPAALAAEVFRGQQALELGNVAIPSDRTRLGTGGADMSMIFGDLPGGEVVQRQVREATDALYAARMRQTNPAAEPGDIDPDVYLQAMHEVLGGSGRYDLDDALGGAMDINGFPVLLPRGLRAGDAQEAWDTISGRQYFDLPAADRIAALTAASLTGAAPAFADDPQFFDDLASARIIARGEDVFILAVGTQGYGTQALPGANGGEFRFSMRRLIEALR